MKVPAWELWSDDHSWGVRELDTRKIREGASIGEAYSGTIHHLDMDIHVSRSGEDDAVIVGQFLKEWAWQVGVPQLREDNEALQKEIDRIHQAVRDYDHEELRKKIEAK